MSSDYQKKLRLIRKAEGLTQAAMAKETGISLSSIRNYETGGQEIGLTIIERVIQLPRFMKYTLWLMTDQTATEAGQIAPIGHENLTKGDDNPPAIKQSN